MSRSRRVVRFHTFDGRGDAISEQRRSGNLDISPPPHYPWHDLNQAPDSNGEPQSPVGKRLKFLRRMPDCLPHPLRDAGSEEQLDLLDLLVRPDAPGVRDQLIQLKVVGYIRVC